jgi:PAS domain S-box-containing protein
VLGYSKEELESMTVNDIAHPEVRDISPAFMRMSVYGKPSSNIFEKRYISRNSAIVYGQVSASLIRDHTGNPVFYISHLQDVTKRKQAENERERLIEALKKSISEIKKLKTAFDVVLHR